MDINFVKTLDQTQRSNQNKAIKIELRMRKKGPGSLALKLSTGRSGSGLCLTRNWLDHFGFSMLRPAAARWTESVRVVKFSSGSDQSLVDFRLCEYLLDFAKSHRFWRDLTRSWRDLGKSRRDQADLGEIWLNLDEISAYLEEIRPNLDEISPDSSSSGRISTDRTKNGRFSFEFRSDLNRSDRKCAIFQSDTVRLVKYRFLSLKPANRLAVF